MENAFAELQADPGSGVAVGLSGVGQPLQIVWQPAIDTAADRYELEVDKRTRTIGTTARGLLGITYAARTHVHSSTEAPDSDFISMANLRQAGNIHHLATTTRVGESALAQLNRQFDVTKLSDVIAPSQETRRLGRYAWALVSMGPPRVGDRDPRSLLGNLQLLAKPPGSTEPQVANVPMQSFREALNRGLIKPGTAISIHERPPLPPQLVRILVGKDAQETVERLTETFGVGTIGAVKFIGPGPHEDVLTFGERT